MNNQIGILLKVNADKSRVETITILANCDGDQAIAEKALAQLLRPSGWLMLRRLLNNQS